MKVSCISFIYLFASVIVFNTIAFFSKKRMSVSEMYITLLFNHVLQIFTDIIFDIKYDWYGYFYKGTDFLGLIVELGIYPAFIFIYLNFFPYGKKQKTKIVYVLAYSAFALFYEWTSVLSGFFYHNAWKLWYSACAKLKNPTCHFLY